MWYTKMVKLSCISNWNIHPHLFLLNMLSEYSHDEIRSIPYCTTQTLMIGIPSFLDITPSFVWSICSCYKYCIIFKTKPAVLSSFFQFFFPFIRHQKEHMCVLRTTDAVSIVSAGNRHHSHNLFILPEVSYNIKSSLSGDE